MWCTIQRNRVRINRRLFLNVPYKTWLCKFCIFGRFFNIQKCVSTSHFVYFKQKRGLNHLLSTLYTLKSFMYTVGVSRLLNTFIVFVAFFLRPPFVELFYFNFLKAVNDANLKGDPNFFFLIKHKINFFLNPFEYLMLDIANETTSVMSPLWGLFTPPDYFLTTKGRQVFESYFRN